MYSDRGDAALPAFGFPHSGIRGSKAVQRLTAAYRSRPRPSSTPGAKASTVCPYYLDGDQIDTESVDLGDTRLLIGQLCSFQGPERGANRTVTSVTNGRCRRGRSLKTQQHVCSAPKRLAFDQVRSTFQARGSWCHRGAALELSKARRWTAIQRGSLG